MCGNRCGIRNKRRGRQIHLFDWNKTTGGFRQLKACGDYSWWRGFTADCSRCCLKTPTFLGYRCWTFDTKTKSQISSEPSVSSDFYDHFITISDWRISLYEKVFQSKIVSETNGSLPCYWLNLGWITDVKLLLKQYHDW